MNTPPIYNNASEKIKQIIINLGSSLFSHLRLNELSEDDIIMKYKTLDNVNVKAFYEEQINLLKNEMENTKNYHKEEIKNIHTSYKGQLNSEKNISDDTIEGFKNEIRNLKNEMESYENESKMRIRKEYEEKYEERIEQLKELHKLELGNKDGIIKEKVNELNIQYNHVRPLLDKLTEKKEFKNSTEQGNYGEGLIDEIVKSGVPFDTKADIEDSSQIGGSGDRIIRFNNGFVLMVEVKNEKTINKGDREQFQEHSKKDFEEKKCDVSLFLSLRSQQIPKVGKTIIPICDNKMVYCGLDDNLSLLEKKYKIINCIEEIYLRFNEKKEPQINSTNDNISIYNHCLENLNNHKNDCENIIKNNEKNLEEYRKKRIHINKKLNQIYREIQNKDIKIDEKLIDDKLYIQDFINRIKQWKEEKEIIFRKEFRKKVIDEMNLSELDKTMIKKIKLTDIQ